MLEEGGIAQVQGRDRRELAKHRRDAPLDAGSPAGPMLDDDGAEGPAVGDHRRHEDVPGVRQERSKERVARRVEALDWQDVAALQARVTIESGSLDVVGASAVPWVARTTTRPSDSPSRRARSKPKRPRGPRGRARPGGSASATVVELRADVDEGLQVGSPKAQLALVQRREDRGRDGEQPEGGDVEHRHPIERDPDTRRHLDRR